MSLDSPLKGDNRSSNNTAIRLPSWLRRKPSSSRTTRDVKQLLRQKRLNTVCEEAKCPNIEECFSSGTATFMILGDVCTRGCRFCSVNTGKPAMPQDYFPHEATQVASAVDTLNLNHVVITSVSRDDLDDGGMSGFLLTIDEIRKSNPKVTIEVLIPDFRRKEHVLESLVEAAPDVINHNLETVPRLYRKVRPGASYRGSLDLLRMIKSINPSIVTKTGLMVGLGENREEVEKVMLDASADEVNIFTIGQYMRPSRTHLEVESYLDPSEFKYFTDYAHENELFDHIFSGPLVRSSYHASEQLLSTSTDNI